MNGLVLNLPWQDALAAFSMFVRASAFVAVAPVVGGQAIPPRVRIGLALVLIFLLTPVVPRPSTDAGLLFIAASEMLIGLMVALGARMLIEVAGYAGSLAGFPTGLSIATLLDPLTQVNSSVLGSLYAMLTMLVYLGIGGHRQLIAVLARSYELVPVGTAALPEAWFEAIVLMTGRIVMLGFRLAAPILIAGLLVDMCLGLIARAVPQLHVLIVGAPIRLTVGLLALGFSLYALVPLMSDSLDAALRDSANFINSVAR